MRELPKRPPLALGPLYNATATGANAVLMMCSDSAGKNRRKAGAKFLGALYCSWYVLFVEVWKRGAAVGMDERIRRRIWILGGTSEEKNSAGFVATH